MPGSREESLHDILSGIVHAFNIRQPRLVVTCMHYIFIYLPVLCDELFHKFMILLRCPLRFFRCVYLLIQYTNTYIEGTYS